MILIKNIIIETIDNLSLRTLYHGSKHLFNNFDITKINTGQHSQDFGYGLYFTSDKETAIFYANELSNTKSAIEKYNDLILTNTKNSILFDYIENNRIISAKRVLGELIDQKIENVEEWKNLLDALNLVQRYGYVYTVQINGGNFMERIDYTLLQKKTKFDDKKMNVLLLKDGYNGIKYKIKSFGLEKNRNLDKEYNVVIIDDSIISIKKVEKFNFEGTLKLKHF